MDRRQNLQANGRKTQNLRLWVKYKFSHSYSNVVIKVNDALIKT